MWLTGHVDTGRGHLDRFPLTNVACQPHITVYYKSNCSPHAVIGVGILVT